MGGAADSEDKIVLPPMSEEEKELTRITVELGGIQLDTVERQQQLQKYLYDLAPELVGDLASRSNLTAAEQDMLSTGRATPEQRGLVEDAVQQALALGESDINRFTQSGLETLRDTLAPGRGLRPEDTPILDRGSQIVQEAARQQGQLVRGLRGQQAQSLLDYPMALTELRSRLRNESIASRLNLANTVGNFGISLNPQFNVPQALSVVQQPRLASQSKKHRASNVESINGILEGGATFTEAYANIGGGTASFAGMCWVAAEFYGWGTPAWWSARNWIVDGWQGRAGDAFRAVYRRHGPRVAGWVRRSRLVRAALRPVFAWARRKGEGL